MPAALDIHGETHRGPAVELAPNLHKLGLESETSELMPFIGGAHKQPPAAAAAAASEHPL